MITWVWHDGCHVSTVVDICTEYFCCIYGPGTNKQNRLTRRQEARIISVFQPRDVARLMFRSCSCRLTNLRRCISPAQITQNASDYSVQALDSDARPISNHNAISNRLAKHDSTRLAYTSTERGRYHSCARNNPEP